jgi:trigger factor
MEVQVAEAGPCRRSLTITIPAEQIRAHVSEAYKSAGQQVQIKGFRAGKVPRRVLEKKYGPAILEEAKESLINDSLEAACREQAIKVLGGVEFSGVDDPLDQDKSYEFQVALDVRPEIKIQRIKGIEAKSEPTEVSDQDIASGLSPRPT